VILRRLGRGASPPKAGSLSCYLEGGYVRGLQTLGPTGDFEFNRLTFVQRLISLRLNRGEMDENVLAGLALDESKSLAGVEPLYRSLFFQLCSLFCLSYLCATSHGLQAKKGAASVDLQPLQRF